MIWKEWKHLTKLDPDRVVSKEAVQAVAESGTDAIMISGTQRITQRKIMKLIELLKPYKIPKIIEPVDASLINYDVDYIFVPSVINTTDLSWLIGKHVEWVRNYEIVWEKVVPEAYIVLNPSSAVGYLTQARRLSSEEAAAYAVCAERYFGFPIIYLECSGSYGDPQLVKVVKERIENATLFYGGGIDSREKAKEMKRYADAIVVGNVLYEKGVDKYLETLI
jgi:phosphoglycerol geranylgeranyltransferase